jgi:hypothetical protein
MTQNGDSRRDGYLASGTLSLAFLANQRRPEVEEDTDWSLKKDGFGPRGPRTSTLMPCTILERDYGMVRRQAASAGRGVHTRVFTAVRLETSVVQARLLSSCSLFSRCKLLWMLVLARRRREICLRAIRNPNRGADWSRPKPLYHVVSDQSFEIRWHLLHWSISEVAVVCEQHKDLCPVQQASQAVNG